MMKYNLNQEVVQAQWGGERQIFDRPFLIAMFVFLLSAFGAWKYTFNTPNWGGSGESGSSKYAMCSAVGASQANMQSKAHVGTVNAPVGSNIGGLKRWSAAGTWEGNTKPTLNDDVLIPANSVVVLDENINVKSLRIEGKLIVDLTKNISITTPYIQLTGTAAYFEWGTETELYNMQGVITLTGSDKTAKIPGTTVESKAILVGEGARLEFHGKSKTSWTNLDANAAVGTKTIKIADANNNWEVGDEILIAPSRLSWNEGEKRTIATISADKKTITLTAGLTYPHIGTIKTYKRQTDGKTWTGDMRAEVGLLSKSIKVQGDASSEMEGFGAHIMIHTEGKARVENTELYRMGQQGILARYPFHWHLLEEKGQGQYFKGNSVHRSFNRGITIHGTESTVVENNFFYDHIGHGLFLEDGSERFNVIRGNVVLLTKRPVAGEELIPSDNEANEVQNRTPASYWITNPNNIFENNVAAGTQGTGFWFAMPQSPMAFSAVIPRFQNIEPYKEPLGKFYGNKAHSCVSGFDIFDQLTAKHALARNGAWQRTDLRLMEACIWWNWWWKNLYRKCGF
jgi:G8 domain/Right handed beta helix region